MGDYGDKVTGIALRMCNRQIYHEVTILVEELAGSNDYSELFDAFYLGDEGFDYWLISDWLANKLHEYGETTFTFCAMSIWRRDIGDMKGCSAYRSDVIQRIVSDIITDAEVLEL